MAIETFPITIYFKVDNFITIDKDEILDPIVTISVNDVIHKENIVLTNPIHVEERIHSDHHSGELVEVTFDLDIDDAATNHANATVTMINYN